MFQRILVPFDGSARAARAIPVAARIARATGGSLVLLTVLPSLEALAWSEVAFYPPEAQSKEHERAEVELRRVAEDATLRGIPTVQEVLEGNPATTILDVAQERHIDLIVMGSHGRTGIMRWALGSVAQKVARQSPAPVLILRDGANELSDEQPRIRPMRVMIALDGSALAEQALQPAAELSAALSAPFPGAIHLVRVLPFSNDFEYGQDDALTRARREDVQEAQTYLRDLQTRLLKEKPDLYVMTSLAMSMDIAQTLLSIAETGEGEGMNAITSTSDLIALATHGRSGLARWVMGSVTERILGATTLPLLIIRPIMAAESEMPQETGAAVS